MAESSPSPYIPNTPAQVREMLEVIGVSSADELFSDIPTRYRAPVLKLPEPLTEFELRQELEALAGQNWTPQGHPIFLGAGAYHHYIPSVVRQLFTRGEFVTSYTPYQPEVSQGTLQVIFEYQSLVCQLTAMEVANAGMYDGATALAEAALMACRVTGRSKVLALESVSPTYRAVVETYVQGMGLEVKTAARRSPGVTEEAACLLVQHPNLFGYLEDLASLEREAHRRGALLVVSVDPIALGLLKPPGEYGADIVVGETQPLGIPLSFGGPYVGFFACRRQYLRQMPGRIVGRTVDARGRTGYVLTLQTREQHIRRERATSNICTSEALVALTATTYLAALGKQGLRAVAELCYHKAHYAAGLLGALPGYSLPLEGVFFQEFGLRCPVPPSAVNQRLLERGIIGGLDISHLVPNTMLLCVTEMNTREQVHALRDALAEIGAKR